LFDEGPSPQLDVTEAEMSAFVALTLQVGHTVQGRLEDYWTNLGQLFYQFYGQIMVCSSYYHILQFLHFKDNSRNGVAMMDDSHDKLWTKRDLFGILRTNFSKLYNPSEHLASDEIIVKFRGWVIFKQYTPKTCKYFVIKTYYETPMILHMTWICTWVRTVDGTTPVSSPCQ
jgi:hypothetical protein